MQLIQVVSVPEQAAFSTRAAARYLGISANTLRKRSDQGRIPCRRDEAGCRVFLLQDLNDYLSSLPIDTGSGRGKVPTCKDRTLQKKGGQP